MLAYAASEAGSSHSVSCRPTSKPAVNDAGCGRSVRSAICSEMSAAALAAALTDQPLKLPAMMHEDVCIKQEPSTTWLWLCAVGLSDWFGSCHGAWYA